MSTENLSNLLQNFKGGTALVQAIGARIRQERQALGLTLASAGERLGITHAYLSEIERGKKPPPYRVLKAVGAWRGRSIEWLLFGEEGLAAEGTGQVGEEMAPYGAAGPACLPVAGEVAAGPEPSIVETPAQPRRWHRLPKGARLLEVRGDALRPVALPGQHVLVVEGKGQDGDLAVVELKDGRQLFRRCWWSEGGKQLTLESVGPEAGQPPLVVPTARVRRVWRLVGVLF
jgi:transcriptional regulator with XRE-family HTH domain